jgi:dihydroorotate dehydrogenase electron transfer subunit
MNERYLLDCTVLANDEVAPHQYRMRLNAPKIARVSKPGQFCMLEVATGMYPFLRRPMCFERIEGDEIAILYKVEGEGTSLLSRFIKGQTINVQGPLGNGFPIESGFERHILVAGGIGVATFPCVAEALIKASGRPPEVLLAARSKHLILCEKEFREMGCLIHIATDDGSAGEKAFASQMLQKLKPDAKTRVYVCGPMIMMKTVSDVAVELGADCLVSLEAQMACGDGACLGCVVESKLEREGEKMVRVCLDGPVFDTRIIDWESHNFAHAS